MDISSPSYLDFQSLAGLKGSARKQSGESLEAVARQFEGIFIQMMLKSMRDATPGEDLFGSDQSEMYLDLHDRQLSLELTRGHGLGIARMIVDQLRPHGESSTVPNNPLENHTLGSIPASPNNITLLETKPQNHTPKTPADFVEMVWQDAKRASQELGISPNVLIAQAALETGWGSFLPKGQDGRSSHNYFGIKAGPEWPGERVTKTTLEFFNATPRRIESDFRAYQSIPEGFTDYVDFIKSQPRYQEAISSSSGDKDYIVAIHQAGYATDPEYSRKVTDILNGTTLNSALTDLKRQPT